jgi:hypothetical protein
LAVCEDGAVDAFEGRIDDGLADAFEHLALPGLDGEDVIEREIELLFLLSVLIAYSNFLISEGENECRGRLPLLVRPNPYENANPVLLHYKLILSLKCVLLNKIAYRMQQKSSTSIRSVVFEIVLVEG